MKKVAILTDFVNFDRGYSLCRIVANQCKILSKLGYKPRLIVQNFFPDSDAIFYPGAEIVKLNMGRPWDNRIEIDKHTAKEIETFAPQLETILTDIDVVMTHDLLFQANQLKLHVASRRLAKIRDDLKWLHWIHSAGFAPSDTGPFTNELAGRFPNSHLIAFSHEELRRKGSAFGYEQDQIVVIPNPVDFAENFHPAAKAIIEKGRLMMADCVIVYPCRLDRGKQPHLIVELAVAMHKRDYDTRLVICDFHSTSGDKVTYRDSMKKMAGIHGVPLLFSSELGREYVYSIPNKAITDLIELSDIFVHPSTSEGDSLILQEAIWKRCGLLLNYDLLPFRVYEGKALMGRFGSRMDVTTGMLGMTDVKYDDRAKYMEQLAAACIYTLDHNPLLSLHIEARQTRSPEAIGRTLWSVIEAS